jgi:A/G-specific adenine glycosylase
MNYRSTGRQLPWRESKEPYAVWVSEIILQQTRVAQGTEYFMTFLRYFPNVQTLASAPESEVLKVWQGLGYYSRALNMHAAAKQIVLEHGGKFPDTFEEIIKLKGIGDYTASAIASIAFGLPYVALDGNVMRVASRIYGFYEPVNSPAGNKKIKEILNQEIRDYDPGEFNQAMMELGATICTPRNPDCAACPVSNRCFAYKHQLQGQLPVVVPKKKPLELHLNYLFLESAGATWIRKRGKDSIWKGLFEFMNVESEDKREAMPDGLSQFLSLSKGFELIDKRSYVHKLTHRTIFASFWHISGLPANIVKESRELLKVEINDLHLYPVHRLMQRYLDDKGVL